MPSSAPADGADYIPAETFSGSKLGYVFQSGTQGTGYYKDGVDKGLPPPPSPAGLMQSLLGIQKIDDLLLNAFS